MRLNIKWKKRNLKRFYRKLDVKKEYLKWIQNVNEVGFLEV